MPGLLDALIAALQTHSQQTIPEALSVGTAPAHGLQRVQDAFDIEEVVAEYNILRGCIHDLADDNGLSLQGRPFHIINRVFDQAIGLALQSYATQRALEVRRRREEYLAFVAHDLRTPLTAISMSGKVLERALPTSDPGSDTARMLRALRRNVQHLEKLVDKVLEENTNLQTEIGIQLQRRDIDLWPLVEALIHDLHPVAGTASTRLINQVPDDLMVYADASLLRRVFQNLIANAINYTPRGEIVIGATGPEADGAVECTVSDNGAGIPEDLLEKVFEMGTTDETDGGTGLGLAIVKNFIEAHGGSGERREQGRGRLYFSVCTACEGGPRSFRWVSPRIGYATGNRLPGARWRQFTGQLCVAAGRWLKMNSPSPSNIRKRKISRTPGEAELLQPFEIDLRSRATLHFSSEDRDHPIEHMLDGSTGKGARYWASARPDVTEEIVLEFDEPQHIARLVYEVEERRVERTQEVRMEYSSDGGRSYAGRFVQEYTFSPDGATFQREDLRMDLRDVTHLRLWVMPNKRGSGAATLTSLRLFGAP